jgi:hypothetical protein
LIRSAWGRRIRRIPRQRRKAEAAPQPERFATSPQRSRQPDSGGTPGPGPYSSAGFQPVARQSCRQPDRLKKITSRQATGAALRPRRLHTLKSLGNLAHGERSPRPLIVQETTMFKTTNPSISCSTAPCRRGGCTLRPRSIQSAGRPHGVRAGRHCFSRGADGVAGVTFS